MKITILCAPEVEGMDLRELSYLDFLLIRGVIDLFTRIQEELDMPVELEYRAFSPTGGTAVLIIPKLGYSGAFLYSHILPDKEIGQVEVVKALAAARINLKSLIASISKNFELKNPRIPQRGEKRMTAIAG